MNKSQYSYLKPSPCTSVWSSAFSSHQLKKKTPPPLFSQVVEMKRKEKWTQEQDGAVNRGSLALSLSLAVLKYSSIGSEGKIAPPFNACSQGSLSSIFFTLFTLTESIPLKLSCINLGLFPLSVHKPPFFFLLLEPCNYTVPDTAHKVLQHCWRPEKGQRRWALIIQSSRFRGIWGVFTILTETPLLKSHWPLTYSKIKVCAHTATENSPRWCNPEVFHS